MTSPDTEKRATNWCEGSCYSQLELPTLFMKWVGITGTPVIVFYFHETDDQKVICLKQHKCIVPMGQESGHKLAGPSAEGFTGLQLSVGRTTVLICSLGASSKLIQIIGRIQSLAVVRLRVPFSCLSSTGDCAQLL